MRSNRTEQSLPLPAQFHRRMSMISNPVNQTLKPLWFRRCRFILQEGQAGPIRYYTRSGLSIGSSSGSRRSEDFPYYARCEHSFSGLILAEAGEEPRPSSTPHLRNQPDADGYFLTQKQARYKVHMTQMILGI